jgi:hypothetical protein
MAPTKALFDIKAEALAAILLEMHPHLTREQLHVHLKGNFERRLSREVSSITGKTTRTIEIHRKGLYDQLPQGIFWGSESGSDKVAAARQRTKTIEKARAFFHPLEQAMYQPRLAAAELEHQWMREVPQFLKQFWGLDAYQAELSDAQQQLLYRLLPEAHRIVGDWAMTAVVFEALIGHPVEIRRIAPLQYELPTVSQPMNCVALGENSYLGGTFQDDTPALEIRILEVTAETLFDFLVGEKERNVPGRQLKVLENVLYPHFLPFDAAYKTRIIMKTNALQEACALNKAVLGFNTILMS